ncbi:MAG: Gldg family protein [Rudaea sp.]
MRERLIDILFTLLLLAAAIMVAFFSTRFSWQHDFSYAQRASLDQRTETLLKRLDAQIAITSFAPPDNQLRGAIADFIARYEHVKPDIALKFVDPDSNPAATREAGIQVNGELVIRYKDRSEQLKVLTERELDNALVRLAREHERLVAFVAGDGERKSDGGANADFGNFGALLKAQGVRAIPLTLTGAMHVPENVDTLVIAAPTVPIADAAVKEFVDYIDRGGNILWLTEPGENVGLAPLFTALSVRALPGVAVDGASTQFGIGDPSFIAIATYPQNPITRDFALTTLFPQSVALGKVLDAKWNIAALLTTTTKSWTETGAIPKQGDTTTISYDESAGEIPGPLNIGFSLTRLSPSPTKREQRAVIIGDADFLSNAFLGNGGNREFGQRVFDWLLQDDELVDIPDKGAPDRQLAISQGQLGAISFIFLVGLPALLLIVGGAIWWRRRRA